MEIINHIVARAEAWALESGLKGPMTSQAKINEDGVFKVDVQGSNGSACCTFLNDGRPSMYERTKK